MTLVTSIGFFASSGTSLLISGSGLRSTCGVGACGGSITLFAGKYDSNFFTMRTASASFSATKWTLPLTLALAMALPISSIVHFWPVTAWITSGPQMNILALPLTMMMKSIKAGE